MNQLATFIKAANDILWGPPMLIALIGFGVLATFGLGFPQIVRLGKSFKQVFGGMFNKSQDAKETISSFQSLATAIAAQIGTGNVAGVATAIISGGPGAVFWMWFAAFFGMGTIFVEAVLSQKYREKRNGQYVAGPSYYIKNGIKSKGISTFLSTFFSIAIIIALGLVGNTVQSNSIADAVSRAFSLPQIGIGIILAVLAAGIFLGGIKRIANFAELVVPFMAIIYIIGSILVLFVFRSNILPAFNLILSSAFEFKAVAGGALGTGVLKAMRYGVARGLFSNEAGMGSTPHAHGIAHVEHPVQQGMSAMVGVFIDTMIVCTCTALVILVTGAHHLGLDAAAVTQAAFSTAFGPIGEKFLAICLTFFSFTTIIGWYYFGESNVRFLFKGKIAIRIYQIFVLGFILMGSVQKVDMVWNFADFTNGLMVIPNLIGIFLLFKQAKTMLIDYDDQLRSGKPLTFDYKYEK